MTELAGLLPVGARGESGKRREASPEVSNTR